MSPVQLVSLQLNQLESFKSPTVSLARILTTQLIDCRGVCNLFFASFSDACLLCASKMPQMSVQRKLSWRWMRWQLPERSNWKKLLARHSRSHAVCVRPGTVPRSCQLRRHSSGVHPFCSCETVLESQSDCRVLSISCNTDA